jgi:hypothetical protein
MSSEIDIVLGDISDVEARVYARYSGRMAQVTLRGTLRGPYCDGNRTLPAEFAFRNLNKDLSAQAEAVVPDPCLWSAEMPHLYQVDVEAMQGECVVAAYHGTIGLRRLSPRRPVDFAPGTG